MIHYKTEEEVELIRQSCKLINDAIAETARILKPGITTLQLNNRAEEFLLDNGGIPSFKGYEGFPFACCISVNDAIVHGFPNSIELKEGDVVSVDVGTIKNGFHGDSAYTFALNGIDDDIANLMRTTKESLYRGIEKAIVGNRTGDIAFAIQDYTERQHGYGVVRELVGHGLGRDLHEDPQVPNYGKRGSGQKLKNGLVIAIEPMINMGGKEIFHDEDGWTIRTRDGKPSAHYEHTICVRPMKADKLSSFEKIEEVEKANPNLFSDY